MPDRKIYGDEYLTLSVQLAPGDHKAAKMKSVEYGVPLAEVVRAALADDALWRRLARAKQAERKARRNASK
jgi:hypothetical protein